MAVLVLVHLRRLLVLRHLPVKVALETLSFVCLLHLDEETFVLPLALLAVLVVGMLLLALRLLQVL